MTRVRVRLALKLVLSLALLGIAIALVELPRLVQVVTRVDAVWMSGAIGAWIVYQAANTKLVATLLAGKATVAKVWRVNLISTYFGLFLPGDAVAGVASRIRYLGLPSWREVAVLTLAERLLTLGVGSALACLAYFASSFSAVLGSLPVVGTIAVFFACVIGLQVLRSAKARQWVARLAERWAIQATLSGAPVVSTQAVTAALVLWFLSGLTAYLVLRSLGAELTLLDAFLFSYLATLLQLVPLFFAGIGIRDLSAIAVLGLIGVPREVALAASLVGLLLLVVSGLAGGVVQVNEERIRPS